MQVLFTSGFENNNFNDFTSTVGSPTIVSTHPKFGSFEMKISSLVSGAEQGVSYTFSTANNSNPFYITGWVYFETLPTADNVIWKINDSGGTSQIEITIGAGGGLIRLKDAGGQIGADIAAIATGVYHFIELYFDLSSGANKHIIWAKIDGGYIATSSTRNLANGVNKIDFCGNGFAEAQTTGVWYMDALKIESFGASKFNNYQSVSGGDGMSFSERIR